MKSVLDIIKLKLPSNTTITEDEMQNAIDEVQNEIFQYCNITELPEGLYYTCANMSVDLLKYTQASFTNNLAQIDANSVSSIKVGDTQINLQSNRGHKVNMDALIMNYNAQLNRFRRMVW